MTSIIDYDREQVGGSTKGFLLRETPHRLQTGNFQCGIGKDYAVEQAILQHYEVNEFDLSHRGWVSTQFVIAIPKHDMAKGMDNLEYFFQQHHIPFTHLYGKEKFCTHPEGHTYENETCSTCPFNPHNAEEDEPVCRYYTQDWENYVVIIPFQHVNILPRRQVHHKRRLLIYSEMPFGEWMTETFIPRGLRWTVDLGEIYPMAFYNIPVHFADNVKIACGFNKDSSLRRLVPHGTREYRYYLWLLKHQTHQIYAEISSKGIQLFSFNTDLAPFSYEKVLVNCGTTPVSVRKKMFGDDIVVHDGISNVENPIIFIGDKWSKDTTQKKVTDFIDFVKAFPGKKFIATKKDELIEDVIKMALPNVDIVHYGEIGTNIYNKEYDAAFVYGGFHYNQWTRYKLSQRLTYEEITDMEDAIVEQAMHRCRPMLHNNVPLIVMSNAGLRKFSQSMMIIHTKQMMEIHGKFKMNSPPSSKWGVDNGLSTNAVTNYRNFLTTISPFFGNIWTETDTVLDAMRKGMSNIQIAEIIGKSVSTVKRLRKKVKVMSDYNFLNCLIEDNQ